MLFWIVIWLVCQVKQNSLAKSSLSSFFFFLKKRNFVYMTSQNVGMNTSTSTAVTAASYKSEWMKTSIFAVSIVSRRSYGEKLATEPVSVPGKQSKGWTHTFDWIVFVFFWWLFTLQIVTQTTSIFYMIQNRHRSYRICRTLYIQVFNNCYPLPHWFTCLGHIFEVFSLHRQCKEDCHLLRFKNRCKTVQRISTYQYLID